MPIGLKHGVVELADHNPEWEVIAHKTIGRLWRILGAAAQDIQHVGSTAVRSIKAKPIIDIAAAVDDFGDVERLTPSVESEGFLRRHWETDEQMLFAIGDYSRPDGLVTHFIHVVETDSSDWHNYINFRDYLNAELSVAKAYEALKIKLATENPLDKGREKYLAGKRDYILQTLQDAKKWACLHDIPGYEVFNKIEPINKGWSSDKKQSQDVLLWFDNMNNPVPTWYLKDFYIQYIDGVPLKLKAPFDLSFLSKYGKVFKVFDDQDSGNLCFGVQDGSSRYFIKFAGALTERYNGSPEAAISLLKATVSIYQDLAHQNLIHFVSAEEIGGGFAVVLDWVDAECMGRQYPLSRQKFMQMPLEKRLEVFEDIMAFHAHVIEKGYVAIDFWDGSIMYDFTENKTILCDIDLYSKAPYMNRMGRLWGSSRFMSPEEFMLGAEIDEITNVYTMGATAFALFADSDRSPEEWPLCKELYDVIKRAVSDERSQRQQSIRQLIEKWGAAKI